MPPAATSTVVALTSNGSAASRLRAGGGSEKDDMATPPHIDVKEHDFFWTYTEEPHRSRRLAIIKAHPEVHSIPIPLYIY